MNKPDWDTYYMAMCFVAARRSIDTSTKCGCVLVDEDNGMFTSGYNSPPRDCDDDEVPMTRPEKYAYMIHSEENALNQAAKQGIRVKGATAYITGFPCSRCFRDLKNAGIKKIVYGPNMAAMHTLDDSIDKSDFEVIKFMNRHNPIKIVEYTGDCSNVFDDAKRDFLDKKEKNG